jgi:hypothetical protein
MKELSDKEIYEQARINYIAELNQEYQGYKQIKEDFLKSIKVVEIQQDEIEIQKDVILSLKTEELKEELNLSKRDIKKIKQQLNTK